MRTAQDRSSPCSGLTMADDNDDDVCMYICMFVCVCMYVFMYSCMHACMYVCMFVNLCGCKYL